jgi:hypothetical protein
LEIAGVARDKGLNVPERRGGNPRIGEADQFTTRFQGAKNFAVFSVVRIVHRPQSKACLDGATGECLCFAITGLTWPLSGAGKSFAYPSEWLGNNPRNAFFYGSECRF